MNCSECKAHCCGGSPVKAPILMPYEVGYFKANATEVRPGYFRINRENGVCHYFKDGKCEIYPFRPLECRLYPWVLTWKDNKLDLRLDELCPDAARGRYKPCVMCGNQQLRYIPESWWKEFETLPE